MNNTYREILPGVCLRVITTDKFKTGCFSLNFLDRLSADRASGNALLPRVLCRGSKTMPDMKSINRAADELYGVKIEPVVRRFGDVQAFGIVCDCVDGAYTGVGESLLAECIRLVSEIVFDPLVSDDGFFSEYVESEKENLKDEIRSEINDKLSYAYRRTVSCMYPESGFGINENGDESHLNEVDGKALYSRYICAVRELPIELFFCGNASFEQVEEAVLSAFSSLAGRTPDRVLPSAAPMCDSVCEVTENMDMEQAVLVLGVSAGIDHSSEDFFAMRMLSAVLGGSTSSKLFVNVREKHSLCYYTGTRYDRYCGAMYLYCGIDPEKVDKARGEMLVQLGECAKEAVSEEELRNAKKRFLTQFKTLNDSPYTLENYWFTETLCGSDITPETAAKLMRRVSVSEIAQVASKCSLKITYLLTGKGVAVNERKYIHGDK